MYGISFSWRPYRVFDGGYATVTFMPKPDQVERSIAEVKEVLADLLQNGIREDEFEGAKGPLVTKVFLPRSLSPNHRRPRPQA